MVKRWTHVLSLERQACYDDSSKIAIFGHFSMTNWHELRTEGRVGVPSVKSQAERLRKYLSSSIRSCFNNSLPEWFSKASSNLANSATTRLSSW